MVSNLKSRRVAVALAVAGVVVPGLHKFYLRQPGWGILYFLFSMSPLGIIPKIASALDAVWYVFQGKTAFDENFNGDPLLKAAPPSPGVDPKHVGAIAEALRQLDSLRQDGLISEYEFEQKRRQLLDRIA